MSGYSRDSSRTTTFGVETTLGCILRLCRPTSVVSDVTFFGTQPHDYSITQSDPIAIWEVSTLLVTTHMHVSCGEDFVDNNLYLFDAKEKTRYFSCGISASSYI